MFKKNRLQVPEVSKSLCEGGIMTREELEKVLDTKNKQLKDIASQINHHQAALQQLNQQGVLCKGAVLQLQELLKLLSDGGQKRE